MKKDLTVLIIDDISVVRHSLKNTLTKIGYSRFLESDNINDAFKIIENNDIEIIFCDWNMPNGDGIELLQKIRAIQDDKYRYLKFIMITGAQDKAFDAMDSGANNIVHKPFDVKNIQTKLELIYHR